MEIYKKHPLSVAHLRQFYESQLGHSVAKKIRTTFKTIYDYEAPATFLGVGYPLPFVENKALWAAPSYQGVFQWTTQGKNKSVLVQTNRLPFADQSIDCILLAHVLEHLPSEKDLLRESWRVLRDGRDLYLVVPNRFSFWSNSRRTPFGYGRSYSVQQLSLLLEASLFQPMVFRQALYGWPSEKKYLNFFDGFCQHITTLGGGVHIVKAQKKVLSFIQTKNTFSRFFSPPSVAS